jgi:hypothetical protein
MTMKDKQEKMNKEKTSLMSEATLWHLYRHLLADAMLASRLPPRPRHKLEPSPTGRTAALAAALAANLLPGDTLGLPINDLSTRLARGLPLAALREVIQHAGEHRPARRSKTVPPPNWLLPADAEHGILPAADEQQATLALGTALASRLHSAQQPGAVTFLLTTLPTGKATPAPTQSRTPAPTPPAPTQFWASAAHHAVALQLPLIFLTESPAGSPHALIPANPKLPAPRLPIIPVDRHDAVALYRVLYQSISRARTLGGPTWIDCRDLPNSNRTSALQNIEATLRTRQFFDRDRKRHIERNLARDFHAASWPEPPQDHAR